MDRFWIIPIVAFVVVGMMLIIAADGRANTPERFILPPMIIIKNSSGISPYVEFCNPNDDFAPDKLIQNSTHKFNHVICEWKEK